MASQTQGAFHHHHGGGSGDQGRGGAISQLFNQLGTPLQNGSLTNAQQIYSSLQQDLR